MTHRLQAGADRLKTMQPQQVQGGCPQRGQRTGTVAPVAMGSLMELGVADPVPALQATAVPHQAQQGFWGGAQAREELVGGPEGLVSLGACRAYFRPTSPQTPLNPSRSQLLQ